MHLNLRSYVFHTNQWIFFHSRKSYIYSRRLQCRLVLFIPNVSYIEIWRHQTFSSIRHWTSSKLEILEYPRFLPAKAKLFPWVEISCTISLIFKEWPISARRHSVIERYLTRKTTSRNYCRCLSSEPMQYGWLQVARMTLNERFPFVLHFSSLVLYHSSPHNCICYV